MAKNTANFFAGLSNSKTRTFVIIIGAIILIGIIIAIMRGKNESQDNLSKQGSQAIAVPSDIKATPGSVVPEKYRELQMQENERRAQEAMQKKSSAIPTIIGAISETPGKGNADAAAIDAALRNQQRDKMGKLGLGEGEGGGFAGGGAFGTGAATGANANAFGAGSAGFGKTARERERELQEQRLKEQRDLQEKQRAEQERLKELERQRKLAEMQQKEYEASVQRIAEKMKTYAGSAYNDWSKITTQQFVQGQLAGKAFKSNTESATSSSSSSSSQTTSKGTGASASAIRYGNVRPAVKQVFIKSGTILFGVLDTSVNSDEPGPILATIVSGKYNGGKLIGTFQHAAQQEAVTMSFNQMTLPKRIHSFSVSVVAIDPDTARTALATDYDRHIFSRYGSLFASSFLQGYGQAVSQQGTTTTSPLTGTTTTTTPPLDGKQQFYVAMGEVGKQWSQQIKPYFNTPYTVTVDQGTSVGLLFLSDVEVTDEEG